MTVPCSTALSPLFLRGDGRRSKVACGTFSSFRTRWRDMRGFSGGIPFHWSTSNTVLQMMENDVTDLRLDFDRIFAQNLTPSGQFNQADYLPLHFIYTNAAVTNLSDLCLALNCSGKWCNCDFWKGAFHISSAVYQPPPFTNTLAIILYVNFGVCFLLTLVGIICIYCLWLKEQNPFKKQPTTKQERYRTVAATSGQLKTQLTTPSWKSSIQIESAFFFRVRVSLARCVCPGLSPLSLLATLSKS